jgi:hypothetical protein
MFPGGSFRVPTTTTEVGAMNEPARYLHWGVIQISVGNLIVILLMVLVFVIALFAPFPGRRK